MFCSQAIGLAGLLVVIAVVGKAPPDLVRLLPAAAGGLVGVSALTAFYRALSIGTMSIVAPIASTGVAVPVIVGIATGERPGVLQLAGIGATTAGVILASREQLEANDEHATRMSRASIALALVAAIGFGSFFVGLRESAKADVLWALLAARAAGVTGLTVAVLLRRPRLEAARASLLPLAAMGLLDLAANGLYALATRHGLLSVVAVLGSLYPLATVVLARLVLGERVRRIQELGIATALSGVALIAAG